MYERIVDTRQEAAIVGTELMNSDIGFSLEPRTDGKFWFSVKDCDREKLEEIVMYL